MSIRIPCFFSVSRKQLKIKQFGQSEYNKKSFSLEFAVILFGLYSQCNLIATIYINVYGFVAKH